MSNTTNLNREYRPSGQEIVIKRREIYEATGIMPTTSVVVQHLKQANAKP